MSCYCSIPTKRAILLPGNKQQYIEGTQTEVQCPNGDSSAGARKRFHQMKPTTKLFCLQSFRPPPKIISSENASHLPGFFSRCFTPKTDWFPMLGNSHRASFIQTRASILEHRRLHREERSSGARQLQVRWFYPTGLRRMWVNDWVCLF